MSAAAGDSGARRWDGPLLVLVAGILLTVVLVAMPVLLQERTRDWTAYEQAAARLDAGEPLYVWELATEADEYYLYPPGMAAAWQLVGASEILLAVKVAALLAVGSLAPLVVADPSRRQVGAVLLAVGALLWPPNLYDLMLGNVMALYVGATALAVARRGWVGAGPLGLVLALAAKPAIVPFLLWLAIRHPLDALRTAAVALAASVLIAVVIGPGRYLEYLEALPRMTALAAFFTGNVGLIMVSPWAGMIGIVVGWSIALLAGFRLDERRGAAVALGAMLLSQPTIGFNYAGVLFPAMALLWGRDRIIGTAAFVAVSLVMLVSTVGAAALVIGLSLASWLRSRHVGRASPDVGGGVIGAQ